MKTKIVVAIGIFLAALGILWAQASGRFDPSTYTGSDYLGPQYFPYGSTTRWVQSAAICYTPNLGKYLSVALAENSMCNYPGPNGSDIAINTRWLYPDGSWFDLQGVENDTVPDPIAGAGAYQHTFVGYTDCVNWANPMIYNECYYGCDGTQYPGTCYP